MHRNLSVVKKYKGQTWSYFEGSPLPACCPYGRLPSMCVAVHTRQYGQHRVSKALCERLQSCNDVIQASPGLAELIGVPPAQEELSMKFLVCFGLNDPFHKAQPNKTSQYAARTLNLFHGCKTCGGIRRFASFHFVFKREQWFWSSCLWMKPLYKLSVE